MMLAVAFACVWVFVALYVGWLGRQQRRLADRLSQLTPPGDNSTKDNHAPARVA